MSSLAVEERLGISSETGRKVELRPNWSEDELRAIFRVAYDQVFGRQGVYASESFTSAEALLRNGTINVRQFIQILAKSELYKERFFYNNSQVRFIELNYKHLLGRAPYDQSEIAYHVDLYNSQGYEAEIDSYLYSAEYDNAFGNYVVPFYRGFQSLPGMKTVGYNRIFELFRGSANSDNAQFGGKNSRLRQKVSMNLPNSIRAPLSVVGRSSEAVGRNLTSAAVRGDARVYRIEAIVGGVGSKVAVRQSKRVYTVSYDQLSTTYQEIHRRGGKIVKIEQA